MTQKVIEQSRAIEGIWVSRDVMNCPKILITRYLESVMAYIAIRHLRLEVLTKSMVNKSMEDYVIQKMLKFTKFRAQVNCNFKILSIKEIYANSLRILLYVSFRRIRRFEFIVGKTPCHKINHRYCKNYFKNLPFVYSFLFILSDLDDILLIFFLQEMNANKHWIIFGGFLAYLVLVTLRILWSCKKVNLK